MKRVKINLEDIPQARKELGEVIKASREAQGMTQTALVRSLTQQEGRCIAHHLLKRLEGDIQGGGYHVDSLLVILRHLGLQLEVVIPDGDE